MYPKLGLTTVPILLSWGNYRNIEGQNYLSITGFGSKPRGAVWAVLIRSNWSIVIRYTILYGPSSFVLFL